jgi:hypothetical protein
MVPSLHKVETPYHDNDLILNPIISVYHHQVVDSEPEVAQNFAWAVLEMEDGNFDIWEVSLDGTPKF